MQVDDKYIYSRCVSPKKIWVTNPVTRIEEQREVPCGHCLHCRSTRVSEWVTRMTLQSMYSAYTYFITLTYDSSIIARMCETDERLLLELHPTLHSFNEKSRLQLAPLTLCKRHTQLYWKRLRKATDVKIQYYLVGEYGHKYGRPHYHAIVWSDTAISPTQFQESWIYGNVDVQDVKANSRKCGMDESTAYRYVCKYLYKDFDFNKLPTIHYHKLLYETLKKQKLDDFISNCPCPQDLYLGEYDFVDGHLIQLNDDIEKTDVVPCVYSFAEYLRDFGTFMCCSKSPAIGSRYLQEFLPQFQKGDLRLFGVHGLNLIFPRFYTRKIKESLCPFVALSQKTGQPRTPSYSYNLYSEMSDYLGRLTDYLTYSDYLSDPREHDKLFKVESKLFDNMDFYDLANHIYYVRNYDDMEYSLYRWNKHTRKYDFIKRRLVGDVMLELESMYSLLVERILQPFETSRKYNDLDFEEFVRCNYGTREEFYEHVKSVYDNILNRLAIRQRKYLQTKNKF